MRMILPRCRHALVALAAALAALMAMPVHAQTVPSGFQRQLVTSGVSVPVPLAFTPDGRLLVGEKDAGRIRVIKDGALLSTPMVSIAAFLPGGITFENYNERGLLGLAFDPNFASNGFLYVYYTVCKVAGSGSCALARNRVARFTINGDAALVGSQVVLLDDIPNDAGIHNAGWLGFGPVDGKLYVSVGDGGTNPTNAQVLNSLNGKILRINRDGSIPTDNPYYGQSGRRSEVWAAGFATPGAVASPRTAVSSAPTSDRRPGKRSTSSDRGRTSAGRRRKATSPSRATRSSTCHSTRTTTAPARRSSAATSATAPTSPATTRTATSSATASTAGCAASCSTPAAPRSRRCRPSRPASARSSI